MNGALGVDGAIAANPVAQGSGRAAEQFFGQQYLEDAIAPATIQNSKVVTNILVLVRLASTTELRKNLCKS